MKVLTQISDFRAIPGSIVLAAGFFDGVHKGHQLVLDSAVERAREIAGQAWVLTFDRHPLAALAPSKCPPLLTTLDERLTLLEQSGVDGALVLAFTRRLAVQEPETFIEWLCTDPVQKQAEKHADHVCEIRCGHNWRFGWRAAGTPELLARFGERYGFRVVIVPYADYQGTEISSTRVRCAVRDGRLDDAAAMLGRAYAVRGTVTRGRGMGQRLNAATANMQPDSEVLPPNGVYAVRVRVGGNPQPVNGVANLGVRPTFADAVPDHPMLETHLLDFNDDLYGKIIEVSFLANLRDERAFDSPEGLTAQIAEDIRSARRYF